ncbi:MAG: hypothetical protein PHC33_01960 [Candidatus Omnitrophica bacterium]|nr:hypothetical protein [Candidatus Omnitrophota bacterium]
MKAIKVLVIFILLASFFQPGTGRLWAQEKKEEPPQAGDISEQRKDQGDAHPRQTDETSQPSGNEAKKSLTPAVPVMEIKRLESEEPLYSIELRDVQLMDFFRVIAHDYDLNIIVDSKVSGTITASFTTISLEEALDGIAELSNLTIQKKGNIFRVAPNFVTKIYILKYIEAKKILQGVTAPGTTTAGSPVTTAAAAGTPASSPVGTSSSAGGTSGVSSKGQSTIYDLLSPQGKILLGEKPNSVIVIDYPVNVKKIEEYLDSIDQKMASRVFKLKYLKAADVVGQSAASAGTGTSAASGSASTTTAGSSGGG